MRASKAFKKRPLIAAVQAVCYSMLLNATAQAAPAGGAVVGGNGTINQSGTNTTINQTTQNMAINWQSYNVNTNEHVQYIQPNASSVSLNRILSNDGSMIAGRIDANGRVILVNPNGIFFTPTASLNVGSLIASGLDINPTDFMNGNYLFNAIGGTEGKVINSGIINASLGGNIALIGKQVKNDGLIVANLGTVTLAAGKQAVLTFDNDGLLGVKIRQEILQSELGVDPAVLNNGTIQAQGGKVLLTASQSQDIFTKAVNTNGIQQATSVVVNKDGTFTLGNGADVVNTGSIDTSTTTPSQNIGRIVLIGQNVTSSGTLKANAQNGNAGDIELHAKDTTLLTQNSLTSTRSESNGNGGIVKVLGDKVGLFDQSKVDVSGANGGGQALIGGDNQGKNPNIQNASRTYVSTGSTLYADALQQGNGGKIINWSNDYTWFYGKAFARGGNASGNGGFVEISGKGLSFNGVVDTRAVNGLTGALLFDPTNITILRGTSSSTTSINDANAATVLSSPTTTGNFTVNQSDLESLASTTSINFAASNNITINSLRNGLLALSTGNGNSVTLTAGAAFSMNTGDTIQTNGGSVIIQGATVTAGNIDTTGSFGTTTGGNIKLTSTAGNINVAALTTAGNTTNNTGNIDLAATNGSVILNGGVATSGGNFTASTTGTTGGYFDSGTAGAPIDVSNGSVNIATMGVDTLGRGAYLSSITAGSLAMTSTGGQITQSSISGNLTISGASSFNAGTNAINLPNNNNDLQGPITLGPSTGGGAVTLVNAPTNATLTTILGAVHATSLSLSTNRNLSLTDNIVTTGATNLSFGTGGASTFTANSGIVFTAGPLTINGGSGNDTFNIGTSIAGTVSGNGGDDTFSITAPGVTVTTIDGGTGTNTLIGGNQVNTWQITSANAGTLNTGTAFSNIQNLTGNANTDNFIYTATGSTSGVVDGAAGTDTVNESALTTVNINLGTGAFTNIENFIGNNTNSTLTGANASNTWNITASNTGTVNDGTNTVNFSGFNNLTGGNLTDNFTLPNAGAIAGTINGSGGTDSLTVNTGDNTWTVTSANTGNVTSISGTTNFTGLEQLNGGTGNDTFNFSVTPTTAAVAINGGGGPGTDTVNLAVSGTVQLGNTGFAGIEILNSNGGLSRLIGDNTANTWNVTGTNSGTVSDGTTTTTFKGFDVLTGGSNVDTFTVSAIGVADTLNGGAGNDTFTIIKGGAVNNINGGTGNDQVSLGSNAVVNIGSGVSLGTININSIEGVISSNGTLNARDGYDTTWSITGSDSGSAVEAGNGGASLTFTGFSTLNGSNGNDIFNITADGSLTGQINAGAGTNSLNVALTANRAPGQIYYIGGSGQDTVTITGASNTVVYNSALNLNSNTYDRLAYTGTNTFNVNYTPASVESVNDQVAANTLAVNGTTGNDSIALSTGAFTVNGSTTVNFTNNNKSNLIVDGGLTTAGQVGTDTIAINGNFSTATNNLTLRNAATVTQAAGTLAANELTLDQITTLPAQLNTAISTLSVTNSGPVSINQTGNLVLNNVNTGSLAVHATGNITDTNTAQRNITGALTLSTAGNILLDHANYNYLSGPIDLTGNTININNSVATNFAAVNTNNLTVTSVGDITQTGAIVAPVAILNAAGNITLNNAGNDFSNLTVNAAAIAITDKNSIDTGTLTAADITLNTVTGVGGQGAPINTNTAHLTVNNSTSGGVYVTNNGNATIGITNVGNIALNNNGDLTIDKLYTSGADFLDRSQYHDITLNVTNGRVQAMMQHTDYRTTPDIAANNLDVIVQGGGGFGTQVRPISLSVVNRFSYIGGRGFVYYYGNQQPNFVATAADLVSFSALDTLTSLQLLQLESLGEFDPAIFTEVRNYYYEDVAIMMPVDQRLDATDEAESEEEKQIKPESGAGHK